MKKRSDYVTNSSSSSFVCEICGRQESGYDYGLSEAEMYECENGHTFCIDEALEVNPSDLILFILSKGYHKITWPEYKEYTKEELDDMNFSKLLDLAAEGGNYGVPESMCPICNFLEYSQFDMCNYLERKYEISKTEAFAAIKAINRRRKKLYDNEYISYVCQKLSLNPVEIVENWKKTFKSYHEFKTYINKGKLI